MKLFAFQSHLQFNNSSHTFAITDKIIKIKKFINSKPQLNRLQICEISSSHGGEYDVQSCLLIPDDGGSTHL
jgi:hypothetical protein